MTEFKNAIPASFIYQKHGKNVGLHGKIHSINESRNTVSMSFNGYPGFHEVSMDNVYITEGIIDSLKNAGKAVVNAFKAVIKRVKGFLLPVTEDGQVDQSYLNAPVNIAVMQQEGRMPECVKFYPSDNMIAAAEEEGVYVEDGGDIEESFGDETDMINNYWKRVMTTYTANESMSIRRAVRKVNESIYGRRNRRSLNESAISVGQVKYGNGPGLYGNEYSTKGVIAKVKENILTQLKRGVGEPATVRPLMIWGAPGIGKTMILSNICKALKKDRGLNLSYFGVSCTGLTADEWSLPKINIEMDEEGNEVREISSRGFEDKKKRSFLKKVLFGTAKTITAPRTWLPAYPLSGNPEIDQARDDFYNSGSFIIGNTTKYDGGVILFDEYARLPENSKSIMMQISEQYAYNELRIASKWALVYASNRWEDTNSEDDTPTQYIREQAQSDRFTHIHYTPTKEEWLVWARSINPKTGKRNIFEKYCAFIEQSPDYVWYDALAFGSKELATDDAKNIAAYKKLQSGAVMNKSEIDGLKDIGDDLGKESNATWTPRDWQRAVNNTELAVLETIFEGHPELFDSIFTPDGDLDELKISQALNVLSPREWNLFADDWAWKIDPRGNMKRIDFYNAYIQEEVISNLGTRDGKVYKEWVSYNDYMKMFTPATCENIWERGALPTEYSKEDDIFWEQQDMYGISGSAKWKRNTALINTVSRIILENYPGGYEAAANDIQNDINSIVYEKWDMPKVQSEYEALAKKYVITVNKKQHDLFILTNNLTLNFESVGYMIQTIKGSVFIQNALNLIKYFGKIALQTQSLGIITNMKHAFGIGGEFMGSIIALLPSGLRSILKVDEYTKALENPELKVQLDAQFILTPIVKFANSIEKRYANKAKTGKF